MSFKRAVVLAAAVLLLLPSACSVGSTNPQVSTGVDATTDFTTARWARRLRSNSAAVTREYLAYTEYQTGALSVAREVDDRLVDARVQRYVDQVGAGSSFLREDDGVLAMVPPEEQTALERQAFLLWLDDPEVAPVVERRLADVLAVQGTNPGVSPPSAVQTTIGPPSASPRTPASPTSSASSASSTSSTSRP